MCLSAPKPPDTSAADAERQRQYEEDRKREEKDREARETEARRQREEDQRAREEWEADQENQRRAESERQASAEAARKRREDEADRQARERAAAVSKYQDDRGTREAGLRERINSAFARYDDAYFQGYAKDYIDYYAPQVQRQAEDAQRRAILALAERGNADSTARASALADIASQRAEAERRIASEGQDAASAYRTNILAQRRDLLNQALSASVLGDPSQVPDDLVGALTQIDSRIAAFNPTIDATVSALKAPDRSALGDLFASPVAASAQSGAAGVGVAGAKTPAANSNSQNVVGDKKKTTQTGSLTVVG